MFGKEPTEIRITKGDEKEFIWNQFYSIIGFSYFNKFNLFNLLTDFFVSLGFLLLF